MRNANRLENAWTPEWDLGLQVEFDFGAKAERRDESIKAEERGWSLATKEVLNRQVSVDRRIGSDGADIGSLISYFESLYNTSETR